MAPRLYIRTALSEAYQLPGSGRVDRDARLIFGVKVIGHDSKNKRTYTDECLRKAVPLYEGQPVYVGHPERAGANRDREEPLGVLENVRAGRDGLYADLRYQESHPLCKSLVEAAERNPRLWALSHNAHGDARALPDGREEIREILEVHSVDLVRRGATTRGLFEGLDATPRRRWGGLREAMTPAAAYTQARQDHRGATDAIDAGRNEGNVTTKAQRDRRNESAARVQDVAHATHGGLPRTPAPVTESGPASTDLPAVLAAVAKGELTPADAEALLRGTPEPVVESEPTPQEQYHKAYSDQNRWRGRLANASLSDATPTKAQHDAADEADARYEHHLDVAGDPSRIRPAPIVPVREAATPDMRAQHRLGDQARRRADTARAAGDTQGATDANRESFRHSQNVNDTMSRGATPEPVREAWTPDQKSEHQNILSALGRAHEYGVTPKAQEAAYQDSGKHAKNVRDTEQRGAARAHGDLFHESRPQSGTPQVGARRRWGVAAVKADAHGAANGLEEAHDDREGGINPEWSKLHDEHQQHPYRDTPHDEYMGRLNKLNATPIVTHRDPKSNEIARGYPGRNFGDGVTEADAPTIKGGGGPTPTPRGRAPQLATHTGGENHAPPAGEDVPSGGKAAWLRHERRGGPQMADHEADATLRDVAASWGHAGLTPAPRRGAATMHQPPDEATRRGGINEAAYTPKPRPRPNDIPPNPGIRESDAEDDHPGYEGVAAGWHASMGRIDAHVAGARADGDADAIARAMADRNKTISKRHVDEWHQSRHAAPTTEAAGDDPHPREEAPEEPPLTRAEHGANAHHDFRQAAEAANRGDHAEALRVRMSGLHSYSQFRPDQPEARPTSPSAIRTSKTGAYEESAAPPRRWGQPRGSGVREAWTPDQIKRLQVSGYGGENIPDPRRAPSVQDARRAENEHKAYTDALGYHGDTTHTRGARHSPGDHEKVEGDLHESAPESEVKAFARQLLEGVRNAG